MLAGYKLFYVFYIYLSNFFFLIINNFLIVWNQGTFRILSSIAFETVTSHWDESQKASSPDNFLYFQLFQIYVNAEILTIETLEQGVKYAQSLQLVS